MVDGQRAHVLVIGEALVDIVEAADGHIVEAPGGSPLNVAVTLARLGAATRLLTALGDDARADSIESHLADSEVLLVAGARHLARTSTAVARMRPDGSAAYEFDLEWSIADDGGEADVAGADVVHAGSIALFLGPGSAGVRRHLATASTTPGVLVALDPNIRPSLLPSRDAVGHTFEALVPLAHVVKLSDEDASWLYPGRSERDVLDLLLESGPSLAAITRGADGCVLATTPGSYVELPAVPTTVVDTIGAGDAFMGALLHAILELGLARDLATGRAPSCEDLVRIGTSAARVSAVTVSRRGADPPRPAELGTRSPHLAARVAAVDA